MISAIWLGLTVMGAHGATLLENAVCARAESDLLLARDLDKQGDEKAIQALFRAGSIQNLNGVEVTEVEDKYIGGGILALIRVVGTVDFYYVDLGNLVQSAAEQKAEARAKAQAASEKNNAAKLLKSQRSGKPSRQKDSCSEFGTSGAGKKASDAAYRALFTPKDS